MKPQTLSALSLDNIYVRIMCEALDDHGLDSSWALRQAGLSHSSAMRGGTVSAHSVVTFRRAFVTLTNRHRDLWSDVAGRHTMETTQTYGLASRTAQDLEGIVRVLAINDLHGSFVVITGIRDEEDRLVGVEFDASSAPNDLRPFEYVLAIVSQIRSWDSIWAGRLPYRQLHLPESVSLKSIGRREHAGVVRTDGRPRLLWDPEIGTRTLPGANEYLHKRYVQRLKERVAELHHSVSVQARVTERLRAEGGASSTLPQIAADIGVSTRTLQRKLTEQGVTFRELQDAAKRDLAAIALQDTARTIASIAGDLGYSTPSSFTHAFRGWYQQSPSEYRSAITKLEGHAKL